MKKFLLINLLILLIFIISGCTKTISFPPSNSFGSTKVTVNLDNRLQLLRETWHYGGDTATILVWEAIEHAFYNDPKSPIKLEYVSSNLSVQANDFLLLWISYPTTYKITVMLITAKGDKMLIDGIGEGINYSGWPAQEAVENAVLDLQKKVSSLTR